MVKRRDRRGVGIGIGSPEAAPVEADIPVGDVVHYEGHQDFGAGGDVVAVVGRTNRFDGGIEPAQDPTI